MTQPAGWFSLGKLVFTGGANAGLARTVKAYDGQGGFTLAAPLPSAPAPGDPFTAYPGCDLSMAACSAKFANLARFRGQPFIPAPSTGLPT